jgi:hypothetical protein
MTNAATTITIHDPDGNEYVMEWASRFDTDDAWCQFCEHGITSGWALFLGAGGLFVLCDGCAKANAMSDTEPVACDLF